MNKQLAERKEHLASDILSLRKQLEVSHQEGNSCAQYQIESDLKGLEREYQAILTIKNYHTNEDK